MLDNLIVLLAYITAILAMLFVCGLIADYVLPHIRPIERWVSSLPDMEDEEDYL